MTTRARTRSVATASPQLQSFTKGRPAPALHVLIQLDPVQPIDTASSTPSGYRTDPSSDQTDSPTSSRTSLLICDSTVSLPPKKGTMPPQKSPVMTSISRTTSAEITESGPATAAVEQVGRPTRKPKPTTKAIELANNTGSKYFKSLQKADCLDTAETDEIDNGDHLSASENENSKSPRPFTAEKSITEVAKQSVRPLSPTPGTIQGDHQAKESLNRIDAQSPESGGRQAACNATESSLAALTGLATPSQPSECPQISKNDEVVEQTGKKRKASLTASVKMSRTRQKQPQQEQDEEPKANAATSIKKSTRITKSSTKIRADPELEPIAPVMEPPQSSEHASPKKRRPGRPRKEPPKALVAPAELPASGYESIGPPPTRLPRITLKFPSPSSVAGSEESELEDDEAAASSQPKTKKGLPKVRAQQKKTGKLKAEKASIAKPGKRKRSPHNPTEDADEPSEDELAPGPTQPRGMKRSVHTPSVTVGHAKTDSKMPKASARHSTKTPWQTKAPHQQSQKVCNGTCMTMPEMLFAMSEILAGDPEDEPETQEELDAQMLKYCKCEMQQDKVPEKQKIMLKFRGPKKDKDSEAA